MAKVIVMTCFFTKKNEHHSDLRYFYLQYVLEYTCTNAIKKNIYEKIT